MDDAEHSTKTQRTVITSLDCEHALLITLLSVKEEPEDFNIEYNPEWCCDGKALPPDSF